MERLTSRGMAPGAAIRQVASELGKSEAAVRSAYYAARRRRSGEPGTARAGAAAAEMAAPRAHHRPAAPPARPDELYGEMLPLVDAGMTPSQAAHRLGYEEDAAQVARAFGRWRAARAREAAASGGPTRPSATRPTRGRPAEERIRALEAENRAQRAEIARLRRTLGRLRTLLDAAG
jgi:hypothetical protein